MRNRYLRKFAEHQTSAVFADDRKGAIQGRICRQGNLARGSAFRGFGEQMKILYCGMRWDYGLKNRGDSFEHSNIYSALANMGHEIIQFDFMQMVADRGRKKCNSMLIDAVKQHNPALLFAVLFTDQIIPETIETITKKTDTLTFNWFCDDHWRFEDFSRHHAHAFSWVSTTDPASLPKYKSIGYENVILTQWACNHFLCKPTGNPFKFDVTFIGQPHGDRKKVIKYLRKNAIDAKTWGFGWPEGRLSQDQMITTYSDSRINLNLNNSHTRLTDMVLGRRKPDQIKGRNFEVPGCGGFLLTGIVPYLEKYFEIGKEIVCFENKHDMLDKIRYYLDHEDERAAIAKAGYDRTMAEHTYEMRFNEIFARMGL
jgi:spore maturation protein CgeB